MKTDDNWITCEESMPEPHEYVLVFTPFCKYKAMVAIWNGTEWKDCDKGILVQNVSFWQPLPPPPQNF